MKFNRYNAFPSSVYVHVSWVGGGGGGGSGGWGWGRVLGVTVGVLVGGRQKEKMLHVENISAGLCVKIVHGYND